VADRRELREPQGGLLLEQRHRVRPALEARDLRVRVERGPPAQLLAGSIALTWRSSGTCGRGASGRPLHGWDRSQRRTHEWSLIVACTIRASSSFGTLGTSFQRGDAAHLA